ncbi:transcriptional regulator [Algimonas ampicilliniresistens]|jgi:putative transcriptional regulator|uniref:Transcriptional regulator n=1 Tax=Algimonas ampicilliniresistens TaxID=1298735 RepID=A0ABQ5V7M8_9PROT|nr:helix-turn-helix transcriptional regulator [Algimonas ampicilliniresistens]GLQ23509.1 transcriptional regulator [Algimonas ampicilliniresistens]
MGGKKSYIQNQIKRIRLARTDLTQVELARRVGATRQTIISIEAGRYSPSLELAFRLSHVLGEPLEELFQFVPEWD